MITFDPKTGLKIEDTAVIRERIVTYWKNIFKESEKPELNTEPETPAGQIIDGEVALASEKDSDILYLSQMFNPITSEGMFQDALARIYFLNRHIAEPTYVNCEVTGLFGVMIPYGALVQDVNGNTFINTFPTTIGGDGSAIITVRCSIWGAIEVGAGTVTRIITTVPGWDTVNNLTAGITGRIEETQAEFENRRFESVAKNSHGAAASVFGQVANLENVVACRVLENMTCDWIEEFGVQISPHSLYISVYGGSDEEIARAIYLKKDGGCGTNGNTSLTYYPTEEDNDPEGASYTYYIERPEVVGVGFKVQIRNTNNLPFDIKDQVKAAILANFKGESRGNSRVVMAMTLFSSRFYPNVIDLGIDDLIKIQLAFPADSGVYTDSITIPADQMPTLDSDDILVEIV